MGNGQGKPRMKLSKSIKSIPLGLALAGALAGNGCAHRPEPARAVASETPRSLFAQPAWATVSPEELTQYDTLFAMSDVHGNIKRATALLKAAQIITNDSSQDAYRWAGSAKKGKRFLFIITGDFIDKGSESARAILRFNEIEEQARNAGGRVIMLLGNHEAEFLAAPKECAKEMLESAKGIKELQIGGKLSCKDLGKGPLGKIMESLPVGAVVADWLFVHSGYITERANSEADEVYAERAATAILDINKLYKARDYHTLVHPDHSILATHDWWKKKRKDQHDALNLLGLSGMVAGHEPHILDAAGTVAASQTGWFFKLDAGMNEVANDSDGKIMKCAVDTILPDPKSGKLVMIDSKKKPTCDQIDPNEGVLKIPYSGMD